MSDGIGRPVEEPSELRRIAAPTNRCGCRMVGPDVPPDENGKEQVAASRNHEGLPGAMLAPVCGSGLFDLFVQVTVGAIHRIHNSHAAPREYEDRASHINRMP